MQENKTYILKCEDDCWYVGTTNRLATRMKQHFVNKKETAWTRAHKPIEISLVVEGGHDVESLIVKDLILLYGFDKVRGGGYSNLVYPPDYEKKGMASHSLTLIKERL